VFEALIERFGIRRGMNLASFTTLRAGGAAEFFGSVATSGDLAEISAAAHHAGIKVTILGAGSNMLPSDDGVPGLTLRNQAARIAVAKTGEVLADTGCAFQELFLKAAQAGLRGLEFAVGIPGTLGGALASNAGAYRSNVSEFITRLDLVHDGERKWVGPEYLKFSYRDSVLRQPNPPQITVLRVEMKLPKGNPKQIYDEAREYQRQRISKQPPQASAGSFFKNVTDRAFAESLDGLSETLKKAGVVPAGFLIEAAGLKGFRMGGAMQGARHANFILNVGNATSFEIRKLACHTRQVVFDKFGVLLEEEVLYLGDWSRFAA